MKLRKKTAIRKNQISNFASFSEQYVYPTSPLKIRLADLCTHQKTLLKAMEESDIYDFEQLEEFPKARRLIQVYNQRLLKEILKSAAWKRHVKDWQKGIIYDYGLGAEMQLSAPAIKIEKALKLLFVEFTQTLQGFWSTATVAPSGKVTSVNVWETEDVERFIEILFEQNSSSERRMSPSVSATLFAVGTEAKGSNKKFYQVQAFGKSKRWVPAEAD